MLQRSALVFALTVIAISANAKSPMLAEDDARRTTVMRDSALSLGLGARLGYYSVESEFDPSTSVFYDGEIESGVGVQTLTLFVDMHALRSIGVSTGLMLINTGEGGYEATLDSNFNADVTFGESYSTTAWFLGLEGNVIGYGATQLSVGVDMVLADSLSAVYFVGVRFDQGDFVIRPRISYVDVQAELGDDERTFGDFYLYGLGASVDVVWNFSRTEP